MGTLTKWLNSQPGPNAARPPVRQSIDELRRRSLELLADCSRPSDERIRAQLARASSAEQLWQARCDIYQAIAQRHCEAEAVRRLNALLPAFEGWLPPGSLRLL